MRYKLSQIRNSVLNSGLISHRFRTSLTKIKFNLIILAFPNKFYYLCTDIVHHSRKSTGQIPSCRGGNSLNYTLLGNFYLSDSMNNRARDRNT